MISLQKSFFFNKAITKESVIDSSELDFGRTTGGTSYAEKLAVKGLTFEQMQSIYEVYVWVRACVDIIVERATDIAPLIKPVQFEVDEKGKFTDEIKKDMDSFASLLTDPNQNRDTFDDIEKKVFRDILKFDAGAFEIRKSNYNKGNIEIYDVAGKTIKVNKNKKGLFYEPKKAYLQLDPYTMQQTAEFSLGELCYMMANPQSDKIYGLSPLETLVSTVTADLYAESFNMDRFINDATPKFAVLLEGIGQNQTAPTLQRFRKWWDQELRGKGHRPILLTTEGQGKIQFHKVGLTNEEMQFYQYSRWLLQKVMAIYRVQPIVLGLIDENMGKLNSKEQEIIFKANALKPLLRTFANKFNQFAVWPKTGMGKRTVYLDYDLDLVDKKEQAEWHEKYLRNGVLTPNEIRVRGLGLGPVPWGNVPYLQNNLVPFGQNPDGTSAVPAIPMTEEQIVQTPEETTITPSAIAAKMYAGEWLSKQAWLSTTKAGFGMPIGWENIPPSERLIIVEKLYLDRQKQLSKKYFYGK